MKRALVVLAVMLPTLLEIIDTSVVTVSLDHIRGSLSAGIDEATWAVTSYLVANAIVIPITGWLSRFFGRKRYLVGSVVVFTVSSFLCGSAWSVGSLVFFRVIQGLGGGALQPLSQSILLESFPPEKHGAAMAIFGVGVMFGPIIGPLLGGWVTDNWSWPWIFYINIPIGIVSIFLILLAIEDPPYAQRTRMPIDAVGIALLAVGVGSLQFVLDKGQREDWFGSSLIVNFSIVAAVCLGLLVIWEWYEKDPVVDLRLFRDPNYSLGNLVMFVAFLNLFGTIVLLPIYLQSLMGYTSFLAGLVLAPGGLATMLAMPAAGSIVDRGNAKWSMAAGILICAASSYMMSRFNLESDFWSLILPRIILGVGIGFLFVPLMTLSMSHIPNERMSSATGIFNFLRNIGGSVGVAYVTTALARRAQFHQARLVDHLSPLDRDYRIAVDRAGDLLHASGAGGLPPDTLIHGELLRQSSMLAFNDAFLIFAVLFLLLFPLAFVMKRGALRLAAPVH
jgi:MFS transporter, DHA2 family, multidrug resistance protein